MKSPVVGVLVLCGVIAIALSERAASKIGFFDWHAAVVVFGGVLGSLLIAVERSVLKQMAGGLRDLFVKGQRLQDELKQTKLTIQSMSDAWYGQRRREILDLAEKDQSEAIRTAAGCLLNRDSDAAIAERFTGLRTEVLGRLLPVIEGWEVVSRLSPSFGMVGTVTGMVQLFRNMAESSGNLGGAMAMALLATLYGIAFGAAVGGPMVSRMNNQLNERLAVIDWVEKAVLALVSDRERART